MSWAMWRDMQWKTLQVSLWLTAIILLLGIPMIWLSWKHEQQQESSPHPEGEDDEA